jgi:uncharacterized protein YuzE
LQKKFTPIAIVLFLQLAFLGGSLSILSHARIKEEIKTSGSFFLDTSRKKVYVEIRVPEQMSTKFKISDKILVEYPRKGNTITIPCKIVKVQPSLVIGSPVLSQALVDSNNFSTREGEMKIEFRGKNLLQLIRMKNSFSLQNIELNEIKE